MKIQIKDWIEENSFLIDDDFEQQYLSKERVLEMMKELRVSTIKECENAIDWHDQEVKPIDENTIEI